MIFGNTPLPSDRLEDRRGGAALEAIPMRAERCRELAGPSSAKSGKPVPSAGSKTKSAPSRMASARRDGDRSEALIGLAPRHFSATMMARPIGPQPTI